MQPSLKDFIKRVEAVRKNLNGIKAIQLQSDTIKTDIRKIIEDYFNELRPSILSDSMQDAHFINIDKEMQELLPLCHIRASTKKYKAHLFNIRKFLIEADSTIVSSLRTSTVHNDIDLKIIQTLDRILPSAGLSYKQAIQDLTAEQRFSWRGPATDLRESLRETLDHLAPDDNVKTMPGYRQSVETGGPTMKQKVKYILSKRGITKTKSETAENAIDAIETSIGTFVRSVYTRSSISTHTPTNKSEVITVRNFVRVVLTELLEIEI